MPEKPTLHFFPSQEMHRSHCPDAAPKKAMEQLGEEIRTGLRLGDSFSRCSLSQYIVLLPHANYENSCMACRRVIGAFSRKHPHSPAVIHFIVQPLASAEHLFQKKES